MPTPPPAGNGRRLPVAGSEARRRPAPARPRETDRSDPGRDLDRRARVSDPVACATIWVGCGWNGYRRRAPVGVSSPLPNTRYLHSK